LLWHSQVQYRRTIELTWREVSRVADQLQTLALTEPIEIAWWAARILVQGHSRRPCFPLPDAGTWPRLSDDVLRQLSDVVGRPHPHQLPQERDDWPVDHSDEPGGSMAGVFLYGAEETIPDLHQVTALSGAILDSFLSSLEWRSRCWADEEFVTRFLNLIRKGAADGAGEPRSDLLTVLLAHATIHCAEAVELLLPLALGHERAPIRRAAARALAAVDWPAEERVDALIRVLREGDVFARLGILENNLGCSTGTEWLCPWTEQRDPEHTYDLPHLRNRLLPAIIERVGDEHRTVRGAAIQALSVVAPDEPEAVARVIERRSDACQVVRRSVAHFCGSSRLQERTFRVLAELLSDADPEVRAEAICRMAFAKVTEHNFDACRRYAAQALDDPDPRVVAQAAFALHRQLDRPDNLPAKQELSRRLAASVTADSPAMNVIFKGTLISRLDSSLAADGDALVESVAARRPEWLTP
jgi:HEAT repeat protein